MKPHPTLSPADLNWGSIHGDVALAAFAPHVPVQILDGQHASTVPDQL
ncbi:hypothetical protein [Labrys miyagiensis]